MKIEKELLVLAREHHVSLVLANRVINTVKSKNQSEINSLCLNINKYFAKYFKDHFETEETLILYPLMNTDKNSKDICKRLIKEHDDLIYLSSSLADKPELLLEFGQLLKLHTRAEDREIFPNINALSKKQLQAIAESSEKHERIEEFF
ncbi:bacteriohemerythrin [bacterium BMS3Bbin11]|nr:bacteriohemerythrin [bacterium BMS3Abin11]GBE45651.1 bacteriohemerythrin [bacterium BMS3Bbin11]HDH09247.1 hemerythrin domain-containing protein [Gammaproteobacteria bacterium]HDH16360.1 hemerythrin domain-containing protein [Gammaproteobacteria bacterium]